MDKIHFLNETVSFLCLPGNQALLPAGVARKVIRYKITIPINTDCCPALEARSKAPKASVDSGIFKRFFNENR
jgi:hypothetical protein